MLAPQSGLPAATGKDDAGWRGENLDPSPSYARAEGNSHLQNVTWGTGPSKSEKHNPLDIRQFCVGSGEKP